MLETAVTSFTDMSICMFDFCKLVLGRDNVKTSYKNCFNALKRTVRSFTESPDMPICVFDSCSLVLGRTNVKTEQNWL